MKFSSSFLCLGLLIGALGSVPHADAATFVSKDPVTSQVISIRYTDDTTGAVVKVEYFSYYATGALRTKSTVRYTNGILNQSIFEDYDSVTAKVLSRRTTDGANRPIQFEAFSYFATGALRTKYTASYTNSILTQSIFEEYDSFTGKVWSIRIADGSNRLLKAEFFGYFPGGIIRSHSIETYAGGIRIGIVIREFDSATGRVSAIRILDGTGKLVEVKLFMYFTSGAVKSKATETYTNGVKVQTVVEEFDETGARLVARVYDAAGKLVKQY